MELHPSEPDLLSLIRAGRSVMFVIAHPDDEIAAGPLLARAAEQTRTLVVCFTRGEGGGNRIGPERDAALGEIRAQELRASAAVLGTDYHILGFWNDLPGGLRHPEHDRETPAQVISRWYESGRDPKGELVRVIRQWQPDVLLTFDPDQGFTGHAEHCAVGILTTEAFADAAAADRYVEHAREGLALWQPARLYYVVNLYAQELNPNLPAIHPRQVAELIDGQALSPPRNATYLAIALEAWRCHQTQVGRGAPSAFTQRLAGLIGQTALVLAARAPQPE